MSHKPPDNPDPTEAYSLKRNFPAICGAMETWGGCYHPWLRSGCGRNRPGLQGLIVFAALVLLANQSPAFAAYFWAWLGSLVVYRLRIDRARHSQYLGWPWLATTVFPFIKRETTAKAAEVLLLFLIGALVCQADEPLGHFLMAGVVPLGFLFAPSEHVRKQQRIAIEDAKAEAEYYQGLMR